MMARGDTIVKKAIAAVGGRLLLLCGREASIPATAPLIILWGIEEAGWSTRAATAAAKANPLNR